MSLYNTIFGKSTQQTQLSNNYQNQINQNQTNLHESFNDYLNQAAAGLDRQYQDMANVTRYAQMHQTVNLNQSLMDTLRKSSDKKMIGHLYVTCTEEVTWALLQDYEQSLTQPDLYIKWEK
jgi:L-lactate utilization protein LutC